MTASLFLLCAITAVAAQEEDTNHISGKATLYFEASDICPQISKHLTTEAEIGSDVGSNDDEACAAKAAKLVEVMPLISSELDRAADEVPGEAPIFVTATISDLSDAIGSWDVSPFEGVKTCEGLIEAIGTACTIVYPIIEPALPILFGLMCLAFAVGTCACCCCVCCFRSIIDCICCICCSCCKRTPVVIQPVVMQGGKALV